MSAFPKEPRQPTFSTLAKIRQKVKLKAENVVILGGLISIARNIYF